MRHRVLVNKWGIAGFLLLWLMLFTTSCSRQSPSALLPNQDIFLAEHPEATPYVTTIDTMIKFFLREERRGVMTRSIIEETIQGRPNREIEITQYVHGDLVRMESAQGDKQITRILRDHIWYAFANGNLVNKKRIKHTENEPEIRLMPWFSSTIHWLAYNDKMDASFNHLALIEAQVNEEIILLTWDFNSPNKLLSVHMKDRNGSIQKKDAFIDHLLLGDVEDVWYPTTIASTYNTLQYGTGQFVRKSEIQQIDLNWTPREEAFSIDPFYETWQGK